MSVTETFTLPAQPTNGAAEQIPLGGDGFQAPHSEVVALASLDGDASGGVLQLKLRPDARYVSVPTHVSVYVTGGPNPLELRLDVSETSNDTMVHTFSLAQRTEAALGVTQGITLAPEPSMMVNDDPSGAGTPQIFAQIANPGAGATLFMSVRLFQFDRRARELVPTSWILSTLPRGSSVVGT